MLKNLNSPILNLKNEIMKEPDGKDALIKTAIINSLNGEYNDGATGEEKFKRFRLAERIESSQAETELSHEEIVLIKKLVGQAFPPFIVGRIYELLDA